MNLHPDYHRPLTVTIRPEAIHLSPLASALTPGLCNVNAAQVTQVIYRGFMLHYELKLPGGETLIAWKQTQSEAEPLNFAAGERVMAQWSRESNHVISR